MIKFTKNRNIGRKKKVLIMIFLFSLIFMGLNPVSPGNMQKTEKIGENLLISPLTAEVHSEISIIGDTALDDFCDGNGTDGSSWANAHVIKDYIIDAGADGNAIEINDTTLYLIIQNCTVTNSGSGVFDAGIYLNNCTNVKITGCNSSNNNNLGFYLYESSNNSLLGNIVCNNTGLGIFLDSSQNNSLSGNIVCYNTGEDGISLDSSQNNSLSGNNVSYNEGYGIMLFSDSDNNIILGNEISYNYWEGIFIQSATDNITISGNNLSYNDNGIYLSGCVNITISGNNLSHNYDNGIYLSSSNNITLSGNNASYNGEDGIYLFSSNNNTLSGNIVSFNEYGIYMPISNEDNTIWMNYISNNSISQGESGEPSNSWDNGTLGNYWGDFVERYPDATSNNGIWWDWDYEVDTPDYNDTRPLVHPGFPEIESPGNVDYMIGDGGNEISWTITDATILDPHYWIYLDGVEIQTGSWGSGGVIPIDVDGLSIGTNNYVLKCNDGTAWGWKESQIVVNVNEVPKPVIITTSQTISTKNITVEWSEVVDVDSYNVYINGTLTYTTDNLTQNIWLNETGSYSISVTAVNGEEESEHSDAITIIVLIDDSNNNLFWYLFGGGWLLVAGFIGIAFVKVKMKK
ncbi:MAG: right-handed parallel beta-helix repeat-containing protein [Promethearchaeota archaeon]